MSKVSVIMPTYNRGWVIKRAIDSVLNQTFKDIELIITDDGSDDNTKDVLSNITDTRIVNLSSDHKGPSAARNKGLSLAKSELIAYLDSDNSWHPEFLEVMVQKLKPPYEFLYSSENTFLLAGNKQNAKIIGRKVRNVEYNPVKLTYTNYIDINTVLHAKSLIDDVGNFDETLTSLEDWDLFARIALKYPFKIKHIDQVLVDYYYYLKGTESTITNTFADVSDEDIQIAFNLKIGSGDRATILNKIKKQLGEE